ncbi:hypothetical protein PR048_001137 [Dryococelus australis]|uniref:Uncharacterized protein n=1 Tax=Dryococelus australis TaxID=614101 RepID=A0ABQ9IGN2_9NEOP|nr:hypothetical protein PR048_001137 [Dryococelus australis]
MNEKFAPNEELWESYVERLEQLFIAKVLKTNRHSLKRNEFVALLMRHFAPKHSVIAECHFFHKQWCKCF